MADKKATLDPNDKAAIRAAAILAWHDAKTEDDRRAAVARFPVLVEMYSEAQNYRAPAASPAQPT